MDVAAARLRLEVRRRGAADIEAALEMHRDHGVEIGFAHAVEHDVAQWRHGPPAPGNPWGAHTIEWQVSSPPPVFIFDEVPTVVGHPYEYGVPGARHAVFRGKERAPAEVPAADPTAATGDESDLAFQDPCHVSSSRMNQLAAARRSA